MKIFSKFAVVSSVAALAMSMSSAASAQVAGIATVDTTVAIFKSKALGAAYTAISKQFEGSAALMDTKQKEMQPLRAQLDTNKDGKLTQEEVDAARAANNPIIKTLEDKEGEVAALQDPIIRAQVFALQNIASKYEAAQTQVIAAKKIGIILAPDAFLWAPPSVDITPDVTAALNVLVPTVNTTPPANYQPDQQTVQLHEQIQQLLTNLMRQQAAQQRAAAANAPAAKPGAAPTPAGAKPAAKPATDGR